jgi:DNA mismatch repair protein MutS
MRKQYLSLKAAHPDCILFFRLGDFYETFDDDARIVARVCDVVLTSRPVGDDQRVPLAGVPYHAVEGYVARLVEAGYRVAIAEQVSEPGKGLVEREVSRVISRGTVTEPGMLDARRNNYLVAVSMQARGTVAGVAACDITTGEFSATELSAPSLAALEGRIGEELSRLQPSELIPVDWQPADSSLQGLVAALQPLISSVEPWQTAPETAAEALRRHFGVASLDGFGLRDRPEAVRAAAALLAYVRGMSPAALGQLTHLRVYSPGEFMTLDEATRRNLELTETMRSGMGRGGDARGSLLEVLDATLTPMGGRLLRRRLSQPLLDVDAINRRLQAVEGFHSATERRLLVREQLKGMGDLERWTQRIVAGQALPRDLSGLREALERLPALATLLAEGGPPLPAAAVDHAARLQGRLAAALTETPPATLAAPGIFRDDYSADLADLVHRSRHAKEWIANLERTERERLDIKSLKVGFNKVFGYYIEVTATHLAKVPDEYIRKQTIANGERYITPELKEYEALVLNADERRLELEQQLFRALCADIAADAAPLLQLAAALAEVDVDAALADVALRNRYVRPVVDEGPAIVIMGGRHPVVELAQREIPFVPNDTRLQPESAIQIITGPNMSGKSTYLRQVALITLLAQIGSFVPADSAQIGVVDRIFTRLGASDEIHRGQSTFMVEMVETANILHHATSRSLLVLDEIGRGTSTYDGLAIAWAVIEYIHNHPGLRARTLFATHYHELTDLAQRLPHVANYNVAVDEGGAEGPGGAPDVVFLHRIVPGKADRSYGVHVARMAGLPQAAVSRAEEILADLERSGAAGPRRLFEAEVRSGRGNRTAPAAGVQAPLFTEAHPALEALRGLDVNGLTPLDALNRLYELQKLAG